MITLPTFIEEEALWQQGYRHIAGLDEAGRGALAGPVVAGAVIVPAFSQLAGVWAEVRDSKQLSPAQRARLEPQIQEVALAWAIGSVDAATIDQIGIAAATKQAMTDAIAALAQQADFLLLDWVRLPQIHLPQRSLVKADAHIVSVAAASILAKTARDRQMAAFSEIYPLYAFASHKGYGSAAHLRLIQTHGGCTIHRRSFAPFTSIAT